MSLALSAIELPKSLGYGMFLLIDCKILTILLSLNWRVKTTGAYMFTVRLRGLLMIFEAHDLLRICRSVCPK